MAFGTAVLSDIGEIQSGERHGTFHTVLTATTFEDGLKAGRFAKLDTGSLDNMDGSATPSVAGVVLRKVSSSMESAGTIDADTEHRAEYAYYGLVTVDAKAGETPVIFEKVYASNAGDTNDGLATVTNTDVDTGYTYIKTIATNLWLVFACPLDASITAHIADTDDAHDASAISLLDTATLTAAANIETVIAEMLPATNQIAAIADPGDAGAVPVTRSGNCALTSAGAETRTLADPGTVGLTLNITCDVYVGDITLTAASALNQTGNNTLVFGAARDTLTLTSIQVGGVPVWQIVGNDGVALSTV